MSNEQPLSRPRYFDGKLLTAQDLQDEQDYHIEKQRRHNRSLHGYGVVWGLQVSVAGPIDEDEAGTKIKVSPGYAIDQAGNEILVPAAQEAQIPPDAGNTAVWVYLCYLETATDFVPVPGVPDDEEKVEASRIVEDFKLCLAMQPNDCCDGEAGLLLARLALTPAGWVLERSYRPVRLRKFDEMAYSAAAILGMAAGVLVSLWLGRRGCRRS